MMIMSHEFVDRGENEHPVWEGAVVGYLYAAKNRLIPREAIIPQMTQVCMELIRSEMLDNLGNLQGYLRKRNSIVQLIAQKFKPNEIPGLKCVDIYDDEARSHWMMVSFGHKEIASQFARLGVSHEVNETTLRQDTGILKLM